jgi:hypothetical protein
MVTQVGYSVAGRWRSQVALCAVCTMHVATRSVGFLVEPQNKGLRSVSGLASKPLGRFSCLASKSAATISPSLASKPVVTVSPVLASKSVVTVFLIWPQKQG